MSYKKYLGDYRVEEYIDDRGRVRTRATYIAEDYVLKPDVSKTDRRMFVLISIVGWCTYIGALSQITMVARLIYVIFPFAVTAFPLLTTTLASVSLYKAEPRMTRKEADKTVGRLPISSLFTAILPATAFIGFITTAVTIAISAEKSGEIIYGDIIFGILSLLTAASGALIFTKSRKIKACKIEIDTSANTNAKTQKH